MPVVNGINYNEKMITDEELAVVEAIRVGADVSVSFHRLDQLIQVDERMDLFAEIPKSGFSWIREVQRDFDSAHDYITFHKQMGKLNVSCYLDIEKVTPPASIE